MRVNEVQFYAGVVFSAFVLSLFFDPESEDWVSYARYFFTFGLVAYIGLAGLIGLSASAVPKSENTIVVPLYELKNPFPFPNPLVQPTKEVAEVQPSRYDIHILTQGFCTVATIAVVSLVYHLIKGNIFLLLVTPIYAVSRLVCSRIFDAHILRQRVNRPFNDSTLMQDFNELSRSFQQMLRQAKKEMANEFAEEGDDKAGNKKGKKGGKK